MPRLRRNGWGSLGSRKPSSVWLGGDPRSGASDSVPLCESIPLYSAGGAGPPTGGAHLTLRSLGAPVTIRGPGQIPVLRYVLAPIVASAGCNVFFDFFFFLATLLRDVKRQLRPTPEVATFLCYSISIPPQPTVWCGYLLPSARLSASVQVLLFASPVGTARVTLSSSVSQSPSCGQSVWGGFTRPPLVWIWKQNSPSLLSRVMCQANWQLGCGGVTGLPWGSGSSLQLCQPGPRAAHHHAAHAGH